MLPTKARINLALFLTLSWAVTADTDRLNLGAINKGEVLILDPQALWPELPFSGLDNLDFDLGDQDVVVAETQGAFN